MIDRGCLGCLALAKLMDRLWLGAARQTKTESAPIRYWAELVGTDTDSKPAIRWLIALRWWF
jgi:hypothetical protein